MATKLLTDRMIAGLKPAATRREYFDAKVAGLALRVTPTGAKTWTLLYRHRGRLRRLTLGSLDVVTLAQARERARDELHAVSKGADVAAVKQDAKTADTIGALADLYIAKWAKPRKRSWRTDLRLLNHKVLPKWRHRAIADITRAECIQVIDRIADGGAPIVANRIAALLSKLFKFALDQNLVTASPAISLPRPGVERQRDRVITDVELRALWLAWDALPAPMAAFYRLRLLTAQRGGEVASMRWQDVDLETGWWTIPAAASKNKLAHRVPLNPSALALLQSLKTAQVINANNLGQVAPRGKVSKADEKQIDYVLAGARGKRQQSEAAATFGVPDFHGHDLRRTAATIMASGGVARFVIARVLNHVEQSVTAVYDRHGYDAEKTAALAWWDAKLTAILSNTPATVLPFARVS